MTTTNFDAYTRSLDLLRALVPILAKLAARDTDLTEQMRRAAQSTTQNISEGNRRLGRDRANRFRCACGSADEVRACLDIALALAYLDREVVALALELADRVVAMTFKLARG